MDLSLQDAIDNKLINIKAYENNPELYDISYLRNVIDNAIDEYILNPKNEIDSLRKESQNVFNAVLGYVCRTKVADIIKTTDSNSVHDIYIITMLKDIYLDVCYKFNKEINIIGFSRLTNIANNTMNDWLNNTNYTRSDNERLTRARHDVVKDIIKSREDSLSNMLTSGKNPVGTIAILNHAYHWQSDNNVHEEKQKQITLRELPSIQIEQKN